MTVSQNIVREVVGAWPAEAVDSAVADYERLEIDGAIGDCHLRRSATQIMDRLGANRTSVTSWMRDIAFECWRRKALSK